MSIKKYFDRPSEAGEKFLTQARIDALLYHRLKKRLKKDGVNFRKFVEASAKAYLLEK